MRLLRPAVAVLVLLGLLAAPAMARTVHFGGRAVDVPRDWPVLRLAQHPGACVRLDRRAVYLGTPGANQRCPSSAIGRRRAILIEPRSAARPRAAASAVAAPASRPVSSPEALTGLGFYPCAAPSPPRFGPGLPAGSLHRPRLRPLRGPVLADDGRVGGLALPRHRRLHRRRQSGLLAAQPDGEVGRRTGRRRLAPDPDLCRPASADQRLWQLRQAEYR